MQSLRKNSEDLPAYGFRDREYFKLKIYQLPKISSVKEL